MYCTGEWATGWKEEKERISSLLRFQSPGDRSEDKKKKFGVTIERFFLQLCNSCARGKIIKVLKFHRCCVLRLEKPY